MRRSIIFEVRLEAAGTVFIIETDHILCEAEETVERGA
jgi:hypothetical protein